LPEKEILIEAPKPDKNDLAPMYFYVGLLSIFGIPMLFVNFLASFMLLFGALIVFLYHYTRISAVNEAFRLSHGNIEIIKGKRVIWKGKINSIRSVDIDTFSECRAEKGLTMVVLYFKDDSSWSFSYVNYKHSQLEKIKSLIESIN
jgi:hypothetical protein